MEMRFCEWLDSVRKDGILSYRQISTLSGVCESTIGSHIRGEKFPKPAAFVKYIRAFGIPYLWDKPPANLRAAYTKLYNQFLDTEDKYKNFYKEE